MDGKKKKERKRNLEKEKKKRKYIYVYVLFETLRFHFCHLNLFNNAFSVISGCVNKMFLEPLELGIGLSIWGVAQHIISSLENFPLAQPMLYI